MQIKCLHLFTVLKAKPPFLCKIKLWYKVGINFKIVRGYKHVDYKLTCL
jgi:hypothetical protein